MSVVALVKVNVKLFLVGSLVKFEVVVGVVVVVVVVVDGGGMVIASGQSFMDGHVGASVSHIGGAPASCPIGALETKHVTVSSADPFTRPT